MEKKGSRSTQSSPKGVVTDSKKTPGMRHQNDVLFCVIQGQDVTCG